MRKILLLWILVAFFASCEQKLSVELENRFLRISRDTLLFKVEGGQKSVDVYTYKEWEIVGEEVEWCRYEEYHEWDDRNILTFFAEANDGLNKLETVYEVRTDNESKKITVIQLGNAPEILLLRDTVLLDCDTARVKIPYVSNLDFEIKNIADWVTLECKYEGKGDTYLQLLCEKNKTGKERDIVIPLAQVDGEYVKTIYVKQGAVLEGYEAVAPEEVEGLNLLKIKSAAASTVLEGHDLALAYDNDLNTYFQTEWQEEGDFWFSFEFEPNSPAVRYLVYHPRLDNQNQNIKEAELWVKYRGTTDFVKYGTNLQFTQPMASTTISFTTELEIDAVKFVVKQFHSDRTITVNAACCVEMQFLSSEPLYADIFADKACSRLQNGVTLDEIVGMEDEFYRNLAKHLYHGTYETDERVREYVTVQDDVNKAEVKVSSPYVQPMGVYVRENEEMVIFTDRLSSNVSVRCLDIESSLGSHSTVSLKEGVNRIRFKNKGLLYLTVNGNAVPVKIHVAGGVVNGIVQPGILNNIRENEVCSYVDVIGEYTHLLVEKRFVEKADFFEAFARLDEVVGKAREFTGVTLGSKVVKNRLSIFQSQENSGVRTEGVECGEEKIERLLSANNQGTETLWEFGRELGEAYGIIKYNNLWGVKDVTNALCALYLQNFYGVESSLQREDYTGAYNTILVTEEAYASVSDVMAKLVPLWQICRYMELHQGQELFWAEVVAKERAKFDFRPDFVNTFGGFCNEVSGMNCNEFLMAWGLKTGAATGTVLPWNVRYFTVDNSHLFKNPQPVVIGTYRVTNGEYILTGFENVVAYEVYHAGFLCHVEAAPVDRFKVPNYKTSMKLVAVGANGEKIYVD